jgi:glyoxylase-like metal-dependent hydrolase (beta-lactamase superfamily II)
MNRPAAASAALLLLLLVPACGFPQEKKPKTEVELWAFRYGVSRFSERGVFRDGSAARTVDFAWLFYALRREGRWILIDTGFDDPAMIKYFNVTWTDPIALLQKAGVAPEDVSLVLLTHAHFDHIGLADRFPNARIIMSEAARKEAAAHAVPPALRRFFGFSKKIDTFNGKLAIDDGIAMVEIGGHDVGSCIIRLDADKIVFTGDEAYLPENWTGPRANGTVVDAKANLDCLEMLKALGPDWLILTQHDPGTVPAAGENPRRLR